VQAVFPVVDVMKPSGKEDAMSLDLSFYKRGALARDLTVIKDTKDIYAHGQNAATLLLVALAAGLFVLLVWGAK